MPKRGLRTLALVALGIATLLLTALAVVIGINLSNDAHRKRIVQSVANSLHVGMTADEAEAVFKQHALEYSRTSEHIGAMVRTPKGSMKIVHTDTHISASLGPDGRVSGVQIKDAYTGP